MSRRDARDVAFKLIFEYTFSKEEKGDMIDEYVVEAKLDADDEAFVREVYFGVISHYDELIHKISESAEKFAIDRIFKVDLALLLLALYEIEFVDTVPYKVCLSEALRLAETYSTEKSVKYINGVLSKFARK